MKNLTLTLSAVILLSGCSTAGLLKSTEPVQTTYNLRPVTQALSDTGPARIIEIPKPDVPPGFGRDRIALYLQDGQKLDYYASARWPAPFDEVMEDFTRRSLTNALPYAVTINSTQSINADFRLEVKINQFNPVYSGNTSAAPMLESDIEYSLISLPAGDIVSSFTLRNRQQASSPKLDVIIQEMETALRDSHSEAFKKLAPYLDRKAGSSRK